MKGRNVFSRTEAMQIKRLLREKCDSPRAAQKSLRGELRRRLSFYISDFTASTAGFTADDFERLVDENRVRNQG